MDQESWDTPGSEAGVHSLKQVVKAKRLLWLSRAQRATHAQLLTLIPLRISFMIFKRLSLFFIFLTCQERITDRTNIRVRGPALLQMLKLSGTCGSCSVRT